MPRSPRPPRPAATRSPRPALPTVPGGHRRRRRRFSGPERLGALGPRPPQGAKWPPPRGPGASAWSLVPAASALAARARLLCKEKATQSFKVKNEKSRGGGASQHDPAPAPPPGSGARAAVCCRGSRRCGTRSGRGQGRRLTCPAPAQPSPATAPLWPHPEASGAREVVAERARGAVLKRRSLPRRFWETSGGLRWARSRSCNTRRAAAVPGPGGVGAGLLIIIFTISWEGGGCFNNLGARPCLPHLKFPAVESPIILGHRRGVCGLAENPGTLPPCSSPPPPTSSASIPTGTRDSGLPDPRAWAPPHPSS